MCGVVSSNQRGHVNPFCFSHADPSVSGTISFWLLSLHVTGRKEISVQLLLAQLSYRFTCTDPLCFLFCCGSFFYIHSKPTPSHESYGGNSRGGKNGRYYFKRNCVYFNKICLFHSIVVILAKEKVACLSLGSELTLVGFNLI